MVMIHRNDGYGLNIASNTFGGRAVLDHLGELRGTSHSPGNVSDALRPKVKKVKAFPYSIPSVGPGADPGVQAVSPQVIHPAVGCHYFPPGLQLPPQPQSIIALWPVPSYTAW